MCKAPYHDWALTPLGRRRIAEMEALRLEWPQHDVAAEEALLLAPPSLAAPTVRRLILLASFTLLGVILLLAQEDDSPLGGPSYGGNNRQELTDLEAERYMAELGLFSSPFPYAPTGSSNLVGSIAPSVYAAPAPPLEEEAYTKMAGRRPYY